MESVHAHIYGERKREQWISDNNGRTFPLMAAKLHVLLLFYFNQAPKCFISYGSPVPIIMGCVHLLILNASKSLSFGKIVNFIPIWSIVKALVVHAFFGSWGV